MRTNNRMWPAKRFTKSLEFAFFSPTSTNMQFNELRFEKDAKSTRWILPTRQLDDVAKYGWGLIAAGLILTLFMVFWIATPLSWGVDLIRQKVMFGWLFVLFSATGLGGLFFGIRFLVLGFNIKNNRSRVELSIRNNKLISTEKLGWFDWRRKVRLDSIDELEIKNGKKLKRESKQTDGWHALDDTIGFVAKCGDKPFLVMLGYSEEITVQVADQLAAEIGKSVSYQSKKRTRDSEAVLTAPAVDRSSRFETENRSTDHPVPVTVVTEDDSQPAKPTTSNIVVHEKPDGTIAYEVPKVGVVKGSHGIFWFSIAWLAFCSVFFGFFLLAEPEGGEGQPWVAIGLFALLFIGIGVALLVYAINLGTRQVMIGVTHSGLFIERKSILGTKWFEFDRDKVVNIDVGPSGQEVNDKPINELQIMHPTGKKTGLLRHLNDDELDWLVHSLSLNMGLQPPGLDGVSWQAMVRNMDIDNLQFPAASRIVIDETSRGLEIRVPSQYVSKGFLFMTFLGSVFAMIGAAMVIWLPPISAKLFGCVFGLIGLAAAFISIYFGTRRFEIRVEPKQLEIDRFWLLGSDSFTWDRSEIKSIELAFSGTRANSEKLYQLVIRSTIGNSNPTKKSLKLMTYRSTQEIGIAAAILNRELRMDFVDQAVPDETNRG